MTLVSTYQWSAARSDHHRVVLSVELGLVKWGDSFEPFKQLCLLPFCLLTEFQQKAGKSASSSQGFKLNSSVWWSADFLVAQDQKMKWPWIFCSCFYLNICLAAFNRASTKEKELKS
jgi:hypothetical protein